MTEERINEIRARLAAASPGPWRIGPVFDEPQETIVCDAQMVANTVHGNDMPNAALIAHAPTDIADLLDEVDRLRAFWRKIKAYDVQPGVTPEDEAWLQRMVEENGIPPIYETLPPVMGEQQPITDAPCPHGPPCIICRDGFIA